MLLIWISILIINNLITPFLCKVTIAESNGATLKGFSISDFVKSHGYPIEVHQNVQTADGYLLDVHRIPHGISTSGTSNKSCILLVHGLLGSAENWVVLGPSKSLAFLAADKDMDVWMLNARGTQHSRKHVKLSPENPRFWDFSWEEIGLYDLTAVIDYILKVTNQKKLFYAGHSQGSTVYFVMASDKPEYNEKIRLMMGLAPGAMTTFYELPGGEFNVWLQKSLHELTKASGLSEINLSPLLLGYDPNHPEESLLFFPLKGLAAAGVSIKQANHYLQNLISGRFCKFNYGAEENLKVYGSETPPSYRIDRMSAPIAIFYGLADTSAILPLVIRLCQQIPNLVLRYLVPNAFFGHFDFIIGDTAAKDVYAKMFVVMDDY